MPRADTLSAACMWRHPQAYYQHFAIELVETEWVWLVDADDLVMPDALRGLEDVEADVWQVGFRRSDGELYLPPQISNEEYLASWRNVYTAGSMIRTEAYHQAGGFRDLALQDWALWRSLAEAGAVFQASDRAHYHYMRHPYTRGETELTMDARPGHVAEMMGSVAHA